MIRVLQAHLRLRFIDLLRRPSFLIPALFVPSIMFLLVNPVVAAMGVPVETFAASCTGFALLGITLFQFAFMIAQDREMPWDRYVRTLPGAAGVRMVAQILVALSFALAAVALVVGVAILVGGMSLRASWLLRVLSVLLLGGIPFALLGATIGYKFSARGAVGVANLLYILLSFFGGLFMPPDLMWRPLALIAPLLPTRALGALLWGEGGWQYVAVLLGYTVVFALTCYQAYRHDEGERYS